MSQEVAAALVGAGVGGVIAALVAVVLHVLQRKDADEDWRKSNQRDIDWKVEDFVIEVHAFARNPQTQYKREYYDGFGNHQISDYPVYDYDRGNRLCTQAEAFHDRVADPVLKECIGKLKEALQQANYDRRFVEGKEATVHSYSQKFYKRIAELYGDPTKREADPVSSGSV